MSDNESEKGSSASSDYDSENEAAQHSAALKRLKNKDPEFYDFLKDNDQELLNFEDSEVDDLPDDDEEEEATSSKPLTASKFGYLKSEIKKSPSIKLCKQLVSAFKHAVQQADGSSSKSDMACSELFDDVIKLCLIELVPALNKILKLSEENKKKIDPEKSKLWKRVQTLIRTYLIDLLKLFSIMKESSVLVLLLKHTVHLIMYFTKFVKLSKLLLKRMITLWCSEEETVRVLSLIVIVRTIKSMPGDYFSQILKSMYFAYVKNTKFTSPTSWPMINFLKRSLTEVYSLNPEVAYEHAFIYIRQIAIHLRNAITTKKNEAFQTVYNWQYVHCLMFWSHLLCRLNHHEALKTLIYPLVQTIVGTINLIPTAKYVPLRFHLIRSLMQISQETDNFIPTVPFILDVLTLTDYNKKSAFSVRPLNFACCLKVTKAQLSEAGFKEKCITEVCDLLVDYFKIYSHSIGFPELALPAVLQIKSFLKQCKVSKFNQQLKITLGKIDENIAFINEKRRNVSFGVTDNEEIKRWEQSIQELKTPLLKFDKPKEEEVETLPPKKKKKIAK